MVIDAHQHVFWHGHDDEAVVRNMDEHGIDVSWLLTWEGWADEINEEAYAESMDPRDGHAWLPLKGVMEACRRYPDRFVPGYCPNPRDPHAPKRLEAVVRIFGVKMCGEWKFRIPFDDPRCIALFWKAGELNLPVTFHLDVPFLPASASRTLEPYWYGGTVANLECALQQCPDTIFLGHAPGFWRELADDADTNPDMYPDGPVSSDGRLWGLFDAYPNLWADLSAGSARLALSRDMEIGRKFIEKYHERLLFGRDCFDGDMMALLNEMDLSEEVFRRITETNATALLAGEAQDE
ncbi:MAG: amidohydrolase family protein [Candidatus Latescibacteria bacterium]|nr:amidohydrolase family protein [Candidatus Latescibacterota bacterium]